jgi:type II secretory pathway pseudopilin PulG
MAFLLVFGLIVAALLLYLVDRVIKARIQARRLRTMTERLAAATARAEEQQARRQAAVAASGALTSVVPAIKHPLAGGAEDKPGPAAD